MHFLLYRRLLHHIQLIYRSRAKDMSAEILEDTVFLDVSSSANNDNDTLYLSCRDDDAEIIIMANNNRKLVNAMEKLQIMPVASGVVDSIPKIVKNIKPVSPKLHSRRQTIVANSGIPVGTRKKKHTQVIPFQLTTAKTINNLHHRQEMTPPPITTTRHRRCQSSSIRCEFAAKVKQRELEIARMRAQVKEKKLIKKMK